ncbi:MAG: aromatic ring-hydroxylating dioxygenase subunit alpha [Pyrobaculum arsenaticum]|uniref:aromatic ring-hydroxylating dioxygenase subunit alpha n=1 Tax=Pyrobaculum TaxID=2276 RepID=UPI002275D2B3|nr:aromatic ring-hydroxylating dioxygenase subunit alpha [Pyrobaculum arsenaticum]
MRIAVLSSREVPRGRPIGVRRLGMDLVFWRDDSGRIHALLDDCPHRRARLSLGKVVGGKIQCPYHGFEFDGSGKVIKIPALGRSAKLPEYLKAFSMPVYDAYDIVWVWYGGGEPRGAPRFFEDLEGLEAYSEYSEVWGVSLPRAVENQLDVFHLPFVHYNTIGRGGRTLVHGPLVKPVDDYSFVVYPFNQVDRGQRPLRSSEIDVGKLRNYLWFIYPNLWENYISKNMRVVAFFAPVDSVSTKIYLRLYMKVTGVKPLDALIAKLLMPFNVYVLHQDRRVVTSQAGDIMRDKLIHADAPIAMYRRMYLSDKELNKLLEKKSWGKGS